MCAQGLYLWLLNIIIVQLVNVLIFIFLCLHFGRESVRLLKKSVLCLVVALHIAAFNIAEHEIYCFGTGCGNHKHIRVPPLVKGSG